MQWAQLCNEQKLKLEHYLAYSIYFPQKCESYEKENMFFKIITFYESCKIKVIKEYSLKVQRE